MSRLVTALRAVVPDFARHPLTWEDFEATCAQERLTVDVRPWRYDEQLFRRQRRIVLDAKLAPTYRLFAAWHAIGHWVLHPGDEAYYLERGWLSPIERQASLVGLLALIPWNERPAVPHPRACDGRGGPPHVRAARVGRPPSIVRASSLVVQNRHTARRCA